MRSAVATAMVLIETCSAPDFKPATKPLSPASIDSRAASSANIVNTTSRSAAAALGLSARVAPASMTGRALSALRFQIATSCRARARLAAIAAPILPRPMNPICIAGPPPAREGNVTTDAVGTVVCHSRYGLRVPGDAVAEPRQNLLLLILLVVMSRVPNDQPHGLESAYDLRCDSGVVLGLSRQFGRKTQKHENPRL